MELFVRAKGGGGTYVLVPVVQRKIEVVSTTALPQTKGTVI